METVIGSASMKRGLSTLTAHRDFRRIDACGSKGTPPRRYEQYLRRQVQHGHPTAIRPENSKMGGPVILHEKGVVGTADIMFAGCQVLFFNDRWNGHDCRS